MPKRLLPAEKNSKEEKAAQYRYSEAYLRYSIQKFTFVINQGKRSMIFLGNNIIQDETMRKKKACARQAFF
ncbi:hypothetical protein [Pseudomonas sp. Z3-8]|uniref:hypothetical protein n=1 Tax=Pseudomonas sp. Z3-8 TaxID=2817412 RepID=UPI003DA832A1